MVKLFLRFFCPILLFLAFLSSCQKDESVKADSTLQTDSVKKLNSVTAPGNYLASKGTLKITLMDSTYTFNAEQDSIAFVNINTDGKEYFGLTAINKAHTVSFGISSPGAPIAEMESDVAGCQLLMNADGRSNLEYTLTRNPQPKDYGIISIEKYNQDTLLAKGTFRTYLAKDTNKNSPFYITEGSFELKVK